MVESAIEQQLSRLRSAVAQRHGEDAVVFDPDSGSPLDRATRLASLNAHWAIVSSIPVAGTVVVLVRRLIRIALRWYINPIVEQQNAFNDAAVAALYALELETVELRARLAAVEQSTKTSTK